jgi:hypothetical protein
MLGLPKENQTSFPRTIGGDLFNSRPSTSLNHSRNKSWSSGDRISISLCETMPCFVMTRRTTIAVLLKRSGLECDFAVLTKCICRSFLGWPLIAILPTEDGWCIPAISVGEAQVRIYHYGSRYSVGENAHI